MITYNIFDKSYDSRRYKYHDHYSRHMHTDTDKDLPAKRSYPIAQNPVDRDPKEGNAIGIKQSSIIPRPVSYYNHQQDFYIMMILMSLTQYRK